MDTSGLKRLTEELFLNFTKHGWQGRIVSIQHLHELQQEINSRYRQDQFDEEFYRERLAFFDFKVRDLQEAKSLIVIAVPRPQSQVGFTHKGKKLALILPPTYAAFDHTREQVENLLKKTLNPKGYHITRTKLPLKLLAIRSGLGSYGRNNICYVPGMGSFLQLVGVYSDLPCNNDSWQEAKMMEKCQKCQACSLKCPTGAIPSDRFLLRAERCIVFHNERAGNVPFPGWMDNSWHNCLVGCLHCQRVCPENRDVLQWIEEKEEFSGEETALIMQKTVLDQLPTATAEKLRRLDLTEYLGSLPRNLAVFL